MTFFEHVPEPVTECPVCHHPPIRHVEDGTGASCLVCLYQHHRWIEQGVGPFAPKICTKKFTFKLSKHEREQAAIASKESYPQQTICAQPSCGCEWRAHLGYLCPSGDSTFIPDLDSKKPFLYTEH